MKQFLCTFISIAAFFMGTSCDDEDEKTVPGFDTLDVSINAFLRDIAGNDLFNPETPGYINPDSVWIEPGIGKDRTPYYPLAKSPYGSFFIGTKEGLNYLSFRASFYVGNNYTLDYIHWSKEWTDTLRCDLRSPSIIKDIYINGKLIQPDETLTEQLGRSVMFVRPGKE